MIRPAQLADLHALLSIEQGAPTAAHWSEAVYRAIFERHDQRRILLVAEENSDLLAGFAVAANIGTEWELENIVVADPYRKRGIGAQLLQAIIAEARTAGAVEIHAEVRESNPALTGFYKRCGFKEIGRRVKYYTLPDEDAVLISLLISRP